MFKNMNNQDKLQFAIFSAQHVLCDTVDILYSEGLEELAAVADDISRRTEELSRMMDRAHGINAAMRYLSGRRIYA